MKRFLLCLFLCALVPLAALSQELDEETLLSPTPSMVTSTPEPPEQVYAVSDVDITEVEIAIEEDARPDFVHKLLEVAIGELGYTEGPNNYSKYGEWSGDANAAWCAEFVCWCVDQTDQRWGTTLLTQIYPNYSGQNTGRDWFLAKGRFVYRKGNCPGWGYQWIKGSSQILRKNDYIPRSGDLVFFSYNDAGDTEHVALVEYCARNTAGEVLVHVIEGNNPSSVQRNSYRLDDSQILGFGVCEEIIGTTMRYGNSGEVVLAFQHKLHDLGLLDERHLTGVYGGNTKAAVMRFQEEWMSSQSVNGIADQATQQAIDAELETRVNNDPSSWLVTE
ncbi:MAG: CHAP domain-containing protein [Eubacteriales bacterium]|nr:CHAP domain-containing protein [Eubacteriales bacterium]